MINISFKNKLKSKVEILGLVILIVSLFLVSRLTYPFSTPREIALQFLDAAIKGKLEAAFALTAKEAATGKNISQFTKILRQQLPDLRVHPDHIQLRVEKVGPHQTYGQRFGRWIRRVQLDPENIRVDTAISTAQVSRYLEMHFAENEAGEWRIVSFEAYDK